jgi:hypothetical protein
MSEFIYDLLSFVIVGFFCRGAIVAFALHKMMGVKMETTIHPFLLIIISLPFLYGDLVSLDFTMTMFLIGLWGYDFADYYNKKQPKEKSKEEEEVPDKPKIRRVTSSNTSEQKPDRKRKS